MSEGKSKAACRPLGERPISITGVPSNAPRLVHGGTLKLRRLIMWKHHGQEYYTMLVLEEIQLLRDYEKSLCRTIASMKTRLKALEERAVAGSVEARLKAL